MFTINDIQARLDKFKQLDDEIEATSKDDEGRRTEDDK